MRASMPAAGGLLVIGPGAAVAGRTAPARAVSVRREIWFLNMRCWGDFTAMQAEQKPFLLSRHDPRSRRAKEQRHGEGNQCARTINRRSNPLPLPGGEGWGEGEP